ncbi:hypothetical protein [Furfurilactobacillus entadae]|uniref:hypothetical protein n=1 Tax=Furfurilactobacillus entadae TaxID=2922307 RepID=UPI0035ED5246
MTELICDGEEHVDEAEIGHYRVTTEELGSGYFQFDLTSDQGTDSAVAKCTLPDRLVTTASLLGLDWQLRRTN